MNTVKISFEDASHNYATSVNPECDPREILKYFEPGTLINVGHLTDDLRPVKSVTLENSQGQVLGELPIVLDRESVTGNWEKIGNAKVTATAAPADYEPQGRTEFVLLSSSSHRIAYCKGREYGLDHYGAMYYAITLVG